MRHAFAAIDVQLKKRWDLIPSLVNTVKGYAQHEKELLSMVSRLRSLPRSSPDRFAAEAELSHSIGGIFALAEEYPDLKSGEQFLNLQRNLTEIESQISAARRAFNAAVTEWNEGVESFPGVLFAALFKFKTADLFEIPELERSVREVSLL